MLKNLRSLNWTGLAVELALIFIGITAALWFDNLSETREARRTELEVLAGLAQSLSQDTADLATNLRSSTVTRASIDTILLYFDQGRPYGEELATHFGQSSLFTSFIQNPGTYEYLKSIGLSTISSEPIRSAVAEYYEYRVPYLRGVEDQFVDENWSDGMRPQMMEKFTYRFFFEPAVPHDFEALAEDHEYRTVLETTRAVLAWKDSLTRDVLRAAEALLIQIDVYLGEQGS